MMTLHIHEDFRDEILEERADCIWEEDILGGDVLVHFLDGRSRKWSLSHTQLIGQNSQAPQIGLRLRILTDHDSEVISIPLCNLGRNVSRSPTDGVPHFVANMDCPPKVTNLRLQLHVIDEWEKDLGTD